MDLSSGLGPHLSLSEAVRDTSKGEEIRAGEVTAHGRGFDDFHRRKGTKGNESSRRVPTTLRTPREIEIYNRLVSEPLPPASATSSKRSRHRGHSHVVNGHDGPSAPRVATQSTATTASRRAANAAEQRVRSAALHPLAGRVHRHNHDIWGNPSVHVDDTVTAADSATKASVTRAVIPGAAPYTVPRGAVRRPANAHGKQHGTVSEAVPVPSRPTVESGRARTMDRPRAGRRVTGAAASSGVKLHGLSAVGISASEAKDLDGMHHISSEAHAMLSQYLGFSDLTSPDAAGLLGDLLGEALASAAQNASHLLRRGDPLPRPASPPPSGVLAAQVWRSALQYASTAETAGTSPFEQDALATNPPDVCIALCCDALDKLSQRWAGDHGAGRIVDVIKAGLFAAVYEDYNGSPLNVLDEAAAAAGDANAQAARGPPARALPRTESMQLLSHTREGEWNALTPEERAALGHHSAPYFLGRKTRVAATAELRARVAELEAAQHRAQHAGPGYVKELMATMKLSDRRELLVEMLQERPDPRVVEELFDTLRGRASSIALENMLRAAGRESRTAVINKLLLDLPRTQLRPIVDTVLGRATTRDKRYILRALLTLHPELLKEEVLAAVALHLREDAPDTATEDTATATARRLLGSVLGPVRKVLSNNVDFASDFFRDHRSLLLRLFRRDPDLLEDVAARDENLLTFISADGQQAIAARNLLLMQSGVTERARIRRSARPSVTRHKKYTGYHARSTGSSGEESDDDDAAETMATDGDRPASSPSVSVGNAASTKWLQHASGRELNPSLRTRKSVLIASKRAAASLRVGLSQRADPSGRASADEGDELWDIDAESVLSLGSSVTASSNDAEVVEVDAVAVLGRGSTGRAEVDDAKDEEMPVDRPSAGSVEEKGALATIPSGDSDTAADQVSSAHGTPEPDTALRADEDRSGSRSPKLKAPSSMRRDSTSLSGAGIQRLQCFIIAWSDGLQSPPTSKPVMLSRDTTLADVRRVAAEVTGRGEAHSASVAVFSHGTELDRGMNRATLRQLGFKDDAKMDPKMRTFVALDHFQCTQIFSLRKKDMDSWDELSQDALRTHVFGPGMADVGIVPLVLPEAEDGANPVLPAPLVEAVMGCGETQREHIIAATTSSKASSKFYFSQLPAHIREQLQYASPEQRNTVALLLLRSTTGSTRAGGFRRAKALLNARFRQAKEALLRASAKVELLKSREHAAAAEHALSVRSAPAVEEEEDGEGGQTPPETQTTALLEGESVDALASMHDENPLDAIREEKRLANDVEELRKVMTSLESTRTWGVVQLRHRIHHLQQLLFQSPDDEDVIRELEMAQHDLKEGVDADATTEESESESDTSEEEEEEDESPPAQPSRFTEAAENVVRISDNLVEIRWFWTTFMVATRPPEPAPLPKLAVPDVDGTDGHDEAEEDEVDGLTPLPGTEASGKKRGRSTRRRSSARIPSFRRKKGYSGRMPDSISRLLSSAGAEALGKSDVQPLPLPSLEKMIRGLLSERFQTLWNAGDPMVSGPPSLDPLPSSTIEAAAESTLEKLIWPTAAPVVRVGATGPVSEGDTPAGLVGGEAKTGPSEAGDADNAGTQVSPKSTAQIARVSRGLARGRGQGQLWGSSSNLYTASNVSPENSGDESVHTFRASVDLAASSRREPKLSGPKVSDPATAAASSQMLCEFIFHTFLHKYGLRRLAERNVVRLVASVLAHKDKSRIVYLFGQLLGVHSELDGRAIEAIMGVLGCLERHKPTNPTTVEDADSGVTLVAVVRAQRAFREAFGDSGGGGSEVNKACSAVSRAAVSEKQPGGTSMVALDDVMLIAVDAFLGYRTRLNAAAHALFAACDVDDDGFVSRAEVCSVLRIVAPWLSAPQMHALVSKHSRRTAISALSRRRRRAERHLSRNGSALVLAEAEGRDGVVVIESAPPPSAASCSDAADGKPSQSDAGSESDASMSGIGEGDLPALAKTAVSEEASTVDVEVVAQDAFIDLLVLHHEVCPTLPMHAAAAIRTYHHSAVAECVARSHGAAAPAREPAGSLQDLLDPVGAAARHRILGAVDAAAAGMWRALMDIAARRDRAGALAAPIDDDDDDELHTEGDGDGTDSIPSKDRTRPRGVAKRVGVILSAPWLRARVGGPALASAAEAASDPRKGGHDSLLLTLSQGLSKSSRTSEDAYDELDAVWRVMRPALARFIEGLVESAALPAKHAAVCVHQTHPLLQHRVARFVELLNKRAPLAVDATWVALRVLVSECILGPV